MKNKKVYVELSALKGLIRERSSSYRVIAANLCIALPTFSNKINGHRAFNTIELDKIVDLLDIPPGSIGRYFFPHRFI